MATITHAFVSGIADGVDTTLVRPSNWNANHVLAPGTVVDADLAASAKLKETEIDFGSTPTRGATFTVTDSDVTGTSKIMAVQSGAAATGKDQDENEMDALILRAAPGTGQFTLYADSLFGPVVGNFKINYRVSN